MERYIEDLIRNKDFQKKIKHLKRNNKNPKGMYDTWTAKEKAKNDYLNKELGEILDAYEKLRKRCNKVMGSDYWDTKSVISEVYNLDGDQISYIESLLSNENKEIVPFMKSIADLNMCKVLDLHQEELSPFNKGEEIIHLNRRRQSFLGAYPVGVFIHPKASKNDVLDFIEKRWNWIEYLTNQSEEGEI